MMSIRARLLFASSIVLATFLGLTGLALDKAFRDSAQAALDDRLQGHIYALLAAAELIDGRLWLPDKLPEARFSALNSGLYAQVLFKNSVVWHSPSMTGLKIPVRQTVIAGEQSFEYVATDNGHLLYQLNFGVIWEDDQQKPFHYIFSVAEDMQTYYRQVSIFRQSLWGWLIGSVVILLMVQALVLRWGLRPLQLVANDLQQIEKGQQQQLSGQYPSEIMGLTTNLNVLLTNERLHLERYRHTLGDLAHSLKTPLAVLQGEMQAGQISGESKKIALEQIEVMRQLIEYQLQRAATSGRVALNPAVDLQELVDKLIASLKKVYWEKSIIWQVTIDNEAGFYGEAGDLMEVLGNLLDNACKWCQENISITMRAIPGEHRNGVLLQVDDDGVGISDNEKQQVLHRGVRGDVNISGHGIGLAILQDIVDIYGGVLNINASHWGGASFVVKLPGE